MGDKSFDDQFNEAWEKIGRDWLTHHWWELQRSKTLLGKVRTLREIEVFYSRLRGKIASSEMLRHETVRYIKWQRIQNYRKITEYFQCDSCVNERKPTGMLGVGYATSRMRIVIQCYHCRKEILVIDIAEIKNEWIRNSFNITDKNLVV